MRAGETRGESWGLGTVRKSRERGQNQGMEEAVRKKEKCHQDVLSILSRAKD